MTKFTFNKTKTLIALFMLGQTISAQKTEFKTNFSNSIKMRKDGFIYLLKNYLIFMLLALYVNCINAQVSKNVNVANAGTLSTLLTASEKLTVTDLTVTGNIDARDFKFMHEDLAVLSVLDMSNVNIMKYNGLGGTINDNMSYNKNEIPAYSFVTIGPYVGKSTLTSVILPESATYIGNCAFRKCNNIKTITIPRNITTIGADAIAFCANLKTVIFKSSTPPSFTDSSTDAFCLEMYPFKFPIFYVPVGSVELYKNCQDDWKQYKIYYEYILTVTTKPATSISLTTAIFNANIDLITDTAVSSYGFCWNTSGSPTVADSIVDKGSASAPGEYNHYITNLQPATIYYVRAYATDGTGTVYGNEVSFKTAIVPSEAGTISGLQTVCQGQDSVTYTVPIIENATSYSWTLPTGTTGTSTTNSITVNYGITAVSGNIIVKGHNECGYGIASSLPVIVNELPIIYVSDKTIICGDSVSLNATVNYTGAGILKYKWTPSTGLNNDTIANPTATVTNDIDYTVTVTTPNGCSATDNVSVKIIPMNKPEIGIVSINSSNKNIVVWNKPVTTGIDLYSIYRESAVRDIYEKIGTLPYSNLSVFVDSSSAPHVKSYKYKISILDKSGQETPLSNPHKTMHLSINKGQNTTWNLIWEAYEGINVSTYNIYRGSNATNLSLIDAISGSSSQYSDVSAPSGDVFYQLEVISPTLVTPSQVKSSLKKIIDSENTVMMSYNSSRSNVASSITSGIELNAESNKITIYPNPVDDILKIDFIGGSAFEIVNLTGQVVYAGNLNTSNIVQTSNFSSGVYLIKFNAGKKFEYRRMIKK